MKKKNLFERVQELKKQNPEKPDEQIYQDLYDGVQAENRKLRSENRQYKEAKKAPSTAVEITTDGDLLARKTVIVHGEQYTKPTKLVESDTLEKLSGLLRPLLQVTKALYKSGIIQNLELKVRDEHGRTTKETVMDTEGKPLLQPNELLKLRVLLHVLDTNEECRNAVATISKVLKDYTNERLSDLEINQEDAKGTKTISPKYQSTHTDRYEPDLD